MEDGALEKNGESELRLAKSLEKKIPIELTDSKEDILQKAYDVQAEKIAYSPETKEI